MLALENTGNYRIFARNRCSGVAARPLGVPNSSSSMAPRPLGAQNGCSSVLPRPLGARNSCSSVLPRPLGTRNSCSSVAPKPLGTRNSCSSVAPQPLGVRNRCSLRSTLSTQLLQRGSEAIGCSKSLLPSLAIVDIAAPARLRALAVSPLAFVSMSVHSNWSVAPACFCDG